MAQIVVGRLPQATPEYKREPFDMLVRELEQIVVQLNFSYQEDSKSESIARGWFLG